MEPESRTTTIRISKKLHRELKEIKQRENYSGVEDVIRDAIGMEPVTTATIGGVPRVLVAGATVRINWPFSKMKLGDTVNLLVDEDKFDLMHNALKQLKYRKGFSYQVYEPEFDAHKGAYKVSVKRIE